MLVGDLITPAQLIAKEKFAQMLPKKSRETLEKEFGHPETHYSGFWIKASEIAETKKRLPR